MFRNIIVAGTFNILHSGHKALLAKALSSGKRVRVGITSDSFAKEMKTYKTNPFSERKAAIERFFGKEAKRIEIVKLEDKYGDATTTTLSDAIVISPETEEIALEINSIRKGNGLEPLHIILVQMVYACDSKKISCTRILGGEMDAEGKSVS
ncbi:MAG: pantetheine-phosphate adenylyltransferase [Candidatus Micrarchaeota archaeon]